MNAFRIKFSIVMFEAVVFAAVLFAPATSAAADDKKKDDTATAAPAPPLPLTIPKDAVLSPDGRTYNYTDKQGKKWNYVRTPLGIMKVPAGDRPASAVAPDYSRIKVVDKGDTIRFERPSPLGPVIWEKKKSALTDEERRIVDSKADSKAKTQQNEKTQ